MTRCRSPISLLVGISVLSLLPFGCSRDGDDDPGVGQPPSAGTSGTRSTSPAAGGFTASGGSTGKGSGGRAESGGASTSAQGGTVSQGGSAVPSSGGSKAGASSGGAGFGGGSTAGNTSSGGRSQVGGAANGGRSSGGRSSTGGAPTGGNSSGGASNGGSSSGTGCDQPGLVWKTANKTNYTSYPEPGSEECVDFSGCEYEGLFSACDEKRSQEWVKTHNIAAVFPHMSTLALHDLCLKSGSKTMIVTVIDECADSDCEGCCSENRGDADELIDLESFTNERFGVEDGPIMWADLGPTRGQGCE